MNFLELFKQNGLIAAHRGISSLYPENTMAAIRACIGQCDFIEIDVQLSKDFKLVIMHDDTLDRTTNIMQIKEFSSRKSHKVCDFTEDELKKLDYGRGEPLPTLHDALKFVKEHKLYINVEIKDSHDDFDDEFVVDTVLKEINSLNVQNRVLLSSFRLEYLPLCKDKAPNIPTAALVEYEHPKNLLKYLTSLKVDAYNLDDELVDLKIIKKLRDAGFFVNVYTVDNKSRAKELFEIGVNGVFTNYSQNLKQL